MRALAEALLARGWLISGSDVSSQAFDALSASGVRLFHGHATENLPSNTGLVVASDAVPADNPELRRAASLGIPACSYFEMLGRLTAGNTLLAVAGTHGKSSTTAMAAEILRAADLDPTVICGAAPLGHTSGGRAGSGRLALVEACEYRANFLHLRPRQAVVLGIEPDHFDYYESPEQLQRSFEAFARLLPARGLLLACADCPVTLAVAGAASCRVETFGFAPGADWSAEVLARRRGRYAFSVVRRRRHVCDVQLQVPGRHNVLNALAAAALGWHNRASGGQIALGLGRFGGLHRRMETVGMCRGIMCLDDYAHHPTEVRAALATARQMFPGRRLWAVFQPHQASRTARLLDELAASLQNADVLLVAEVFRAREGPPQRGRAQAAELADRARQLGAVVPRRHGMEEITRYLLSRLAPGDVLMTIGAGDIRKVYDGFADGIRKARAAG